nr:MAG TPA: hypothetical protein [Caudoviricetes sp.]
MIYSYYKYICSISQYFCSNLLELFFIILDKTIDCGCAYGNI